MNNVYTEYTNNPRNYYVFKNDYSCTTDSPMGCHTSLDQADWYRFEVSPQRLEPWPMLPIPSD